MKTQLLSLVIALGVSMTSVADDAGDNSVREQAQDELGPGYGMKEMTATFSIDYKALVEGCQQSDNLRKRRKFMSVMLWLAAYGGLDGYYASDHAGKIGYIVSEIGDDAMARLVVGQPEVLRLAAGRDVAFAFALFEPDARSMRNCFQKPSKFLI
ncbi:hypothetical protein [Rubritalea profundi]|uniref:Uncharacterized protein n=1 Tax=Rubritalea profundi TaxID=1658618 RepID=A0A2S7TXZ1_9BACT|nr:hypothetical protein [Rubritalea profundi]PQJ27636.1 hypothetical protein BSZ32_03405 [Rubritalea profundi]